MSVICFDIDGILCTQVEGDYVNALPNRSMIDLVNRLFEDGHTIVLHTSRFMGRCKGNAEQARLIGTDFTRKQLAQWQVRYHELHLGKPRYDIVIDDRSVFFDPDCSKIGSAIDAVVTKRSKGLS